MSVARPATAANPDVLGGLCFVLLWSTGYLSAGFAMEGTGPFTLAVVRFLGSALLIGLLLKLRAAPRPATLAMVHAAIAGILLQAGFFTFIYLAMKTGVPPAVAGLITGLMPLVTVVGARIFLGDALRVPAVLGLVLGLGGVLLVVGPELHAGGDSIPYVYAVLALISLSAGTLYQKRHASELDTRLAMVIQVTISLLVLLPFAWFVEHLSLHATPRVLGGIAWAILINSCAGILLYLWLLGRGAAGRVASLFYLVPPVTAVLASVMLGTRFTLHDGAGFALAAIGVWLGQRT
ncbi:MAG: DMT family transporter [Panacagrimonas sp.]